MKEIIIALIGFLGGGGLTFVGLLLNRHWGREDKREAKEDKRISETIRRLEEKIDDVVQGQKTVVEAQRIVLFERIQYLGLCYIGAKRLSISNKTNIHEMHKAAKALGLNGDLDTIMEEIDRLPVYTDEYSKEK